jgi:O-acetyl-ADP-ribose deacetylase (regulator of RNase III)
MNIVRGNLIAYAQAGKFDLIVHGCNCFHVMGAGIAVEIKRAFPEAYRADLQTIRGSKAKLGTISVAEVTQGVSRPLIVVNGYTQFYYGDRHLECDYDAIRSVFNIVKQRFSGMKIGYPLIGCGLGRGEWPIVRDIINEELTGEDHCLVVLKDDKIFTELFS